jgi:hypothetical protein
MAEFKLGRLRFVWKNVWTNSTTYVKDDIVRYGGKSYVCILGHTADSDATGGFETDLAANKWQLMNDGQSWGDAWATGTFYKVNDVVNYGGRSYIVNESHTSAATTALGLEADFSKWDLFNDGIAFKGTWASTTRYKLNDMVSYGGQVYICNTYHTSTSTFDTVKFTMFATGLQFEGSYDNGTTYQPGDVVSYGANTYVASVTTVGNLPTDTNYFTVITQGVVYKGIYGGATAYKKGDIVTYGASAYVAKQDTVGNLPSNATNWDTMVSGLQSLGAYSGATAYVKGDIVQYGGYSYVAKNNTTGNLPTVTANWDVLTKGYTFIGVYSGVTAYKPGELVSYGGSIYAAKVNTTGTAPSNATNWDLFTQGFSFAGDYAGGTTYKVGEVVKYGAKLYIATAEGSGNLPTNASFFTLYVDGVRLAPNPTYTNGVAYLAGDIVRYGARSYICILGHTSNNGGGIEPPNATYWSLLAAGMFWKGTYSAGTEYELDDTVEYLGSTWISVSANNIGQTPSSSPTKWNLVAQTGDVTPVLTTAGDLLRKGTGGSVERIPVGTGGQILAVNGAGLPAWENNNVTGQVYYVTPEGNNGNDGKSINRAFATIKYACTTVTGPATIFVKSGTYTEILPITIPANVYIVGDSLRSVVIQPQAGDETKTMFLMSNGSLLQKVTMQGLNGFDVGTPGDVDTSTPGGIFIALNPSSPITTKSPYVLECSCFSSGGIGAVVNGSVHGSGFRSIVFHAYTMNNDGGIGIWTSNNGKAEIVSCFTYFCTYGYAASSGGQIRSLNGNNSYGTYGCISGGFDASETAITATLYGQLITYQSANGTFNTGETLNSPTGSATILSSQPSAGVLYVKVNSGTFSAGQTITGTATAVQATISSGGVTGQKGFLVVVAGLTGEPVPGASLNIASAGGTYVIQAVDYTAGATGYKPAGFAILTLTTEKLLPSAEGTGITVRTKYSKVRLTGHDFLAIGSGGKSTAYPTQTASTLQVNEIVENLPGRVFYVSTDQDGNFRVGDFFKVDQATGRATLNANAFDLSGLTSLRLGSIGAQIGEQINEFSADGTLSGNSNLAVPTEQAVKTYVDQSINSLSVAFSIALA